MVVVLFSKDDVDDGGLRVFCSHILDTRLSPSFRLSSAERERIHLTPSVANLILKMAMYSK